MNAAVPGTAAVPESAAVPETVPDDDVERFVPGSETDAEGAHDAPSATHGALADEPVASTFAPHTPAEPTANSAAAIDPEGSDASPAHLADPAREPAPEHASEAAAAAAATTSPSSHVPPPDASRSAAPRRSFVPLAAGVVIGALIGAGSAALVYTQYAPSDADRVDPGRFAALASRVDAIDKRPDPQAALASVKSQLDDLSEKVAALEKRTGTVASPPALAKSASSNPTAPSSTAANTTSPNAPAASTAATGAAKGAATGAKEPTTPVASAQPAAADPALGAKIAALQASLETLQKQSAASRDLAAKVETLQAAVTGAQTLASTSRTNLDALKGQQQTLDGKIGALQTAIGGVQKQASTAQSGVDAVQTEQKTLAGKLGAPALAVVADSLVAQIAGGKPYAIQVDALTSLGADPAKVAVLRENAASGVPSSQTLLAKFEPLADPIVATGSKVPADAGFGDRLKHGLFGLVSVRRTDVTTGNDLPSRVALIESDLAHDDVPGAYAVWTALPADAKQRSEAWGASAKTSVEAINAARALQAASIGSLAAKKS